LDEFMVHLDGVIIPVVYKLMKNKFRIIKDLIVSQRGLGYRMK
jgi:hypothetical protein